MDRARRFGLVALLALIALNVWTGSPLLALWIGSRVQGEESQPSTGAFAAVLGCLVLFSFLLYQALKRVCGSSSSRDPRSAAARVVRARSPRGAPILASAPP